MAQSPHFKLHEALCALCRNTGWSYTVFWRLRPRAFPREVRQRTNRSGEVVASNAANKEKGNWVLMWEDGFSLLNSHRSNGNVFEGVDMCEIDVEALPTTFSKMSYQLYNYGEGLIGKVALRGNHRWVLKDEISPTTPSSVLDSQHDQFPSGWKDQFDAGIRTIAVIAVPQGVIQLGSLIRINEDQAFVQKTRDSFSSLAQIANNDGGIQNKPPRSLSGRSSPPGANHSQDFLSPLSSLLPSLPPRSLSAPISDKNLLKFSPNGAKLNGFIPDSQSLIAAKQGNDLSGNLRQKGMSNDEGESNAISQASNPLISLKSGGNWLKNRSDMDSIHEMAEKLIGHKRSAPMEELPPLNLQSLINSTALSPQSNNTPNLVSQNSIPSSSPSSASLLNAISKSLPFPNSLSQETLALLSNPKLSSALLENPSSLSSLSSLSPSDILQLKLALASRNASTVSPSPSSLTNLINSLIPSISNPNGVASSGTILDNHSSATSGLDAVHGRDQIRSIENSASMNTLNSQDAVSSTGLDSLKINQLNVNNSVHNGGISVTQNLMQNQSQNQRQILQALELGLKLKQTSNSNNFQAYDAYLRELIQNNIKSLSPENQIDICNLLAKKSNDTTSPNSQLQNQDLSLQYLKRLEMQKLEMEKQKIVEERIKGLRQEQLHQLQLLQHSEQLKNFQRLVQQKSNNGSSTIDGSVLDFLNSKSSASSTALDVSSTSGLFSSKSIEGLPSSFLSSRTNSNADLSSISALLQASSHNHGGNPNSSFSNAHNVNDIIRKALLSPRGPLNRSVSTPNPGEYNPEILKRLLSASAKVSGPKNSTDGKDMTNFSLQNGQFQANTSTSNGSDDSIANFRSNSVPMEDFTFNDGVEGYEWLSFTPGFIPGDKNPRSEAYPPALKQQSPNLNETSAQFSHKENLLNLMETRSNFSETQIPHQQCMSSERKIDSPNSSNSSSHISSPQQGKPAESSVLQVSAPTLFPSAPGEANSLQHQGHSRISSPISEIPLPEQNQVKSNFGTLVQGQVTSVSDLASGQTRSFQEINESSDINANVNGSDFMGNMLDDVVAWPSTPSINLNLNSSAGLSSGLTWNSNSNSNQNMNSNLNACMSMNSLPWMDVCSPWIDVGNSETNWNDVSGAEYPSVNLQSALD